MSMSSFATDCVVQETVYRSYCRFCVPKLYRYAVRGQWQKIPRRCKTHPREVKFVHKYVPNDTALHRMVRPPEDACMMKNFLKAANCNQKDMIGICEMKLHAIQAILEACPSVASMTDMLGRTPLHLACMDVSYSMGAVDVLLMVCPMAASLQDIFGKTPLHYLISKNKNVPQPLLDKLIRTFPKAASMHDKEGHTPLSIAQESKEGMAAVYETLSAASTGASSRGTVSLSDYFMNSK